MVRSNLDVDIDTQIAAAMRVGEIASVTEPRAAAADYDAKTGLVNIRLRNGAIYSFPAKITQGLAGAADELIAAVEVTPSGIGLHWEALDADFTVKGLLAGVFGTKKWMANLKEQLNAVS
ncbi:MAG: DUF2442 domain-containing protein [Cyanobacteria bacterium J06576_12]